MAGIGDSITNLGNEILSLGGSAIDATSKLASEGITLLGQAKDKAIGLVSDTASFVLTGHVEKNDLVTLSDKTLLNQKTGDTFKVSKDSILSNLPGLEGYERVNKLETGLLNNVQSDKPSPKADSAAASNTVKANGVDNVLPQGKIDKNGIEFVANQGDKKTENKGLLAGLEIHGSTASKKIGDTTTTRTDDQITVEHENSAKAIKNTLTGSLSFEFQGRQTFGDNGKEKTWTITAGVQTLVSSDPNFFKQMENGQVVAEIGRTETREHIGNVDVVLSDKSINDTAVEAGKKALIRGRDGVKMVEQNSLSTGMTDSGDAFIQLDANRTVLYRKDRNTIVLGVAGRAMQELDLSKPIEDEKVRAAVEVLKVLVDGKEKAFNNDGVKFYIDEHGRAAGMLAGTPIATPTAAKDEASNTEATAKPALFVPLANSALTLFNTPLVLPGSADVKPTAGKTESVPIVVHGDQNGSTMSDGKREVRRDLSGVTQETDAKTGKLNFSVDTNKGEVRTQDVFTNKEGTRDLHSGMLITADRRIVDKDVTVDKNNVVTFSDGTRFEANGTVTLADGRNISGKEVPESTIQQAANNMTNAASIADKVARKASGGDVTLDDIMELEGSLALVNGMLSTFANNPEIFNRLMQMSAQLEGTLGSARASFAANTSRRALGLSSNQNNEQQLRTYNFKSANNGDQNYKKYAFLSSNAIAA